jgi:hypothetical protein
MGDSYVQVGADGVGKKLQSKDNVIGANTVHSEGVFLTDDTGASVNPSKEATQVLAEAHLGTIDTSTAAAEVHVGNIETDLALVHTHVAGVETQDTEINAHVHALDAELVLVHAHIASIETDLALVHTHIAGIETQDTEINAHIHSLDAKDPSQTAYKCAYVNIQADGDILALVAGKKIRVHAIAIQAIDTSSGTIETGAGAGAIKLKWSLAAREGMVLPWNPAGWFETVAGEALYADFVVGAETMFVITYSEV